MSTEEPGLTPADYEQLADMAEHGAREYQRTAGDPGRPDEPSPERVVCEHCGHTWVYEGDHHRALCTECRRWTYLGADGRGLTIQQCNAIREAARDGLSYPAIGRLFSFLDGKQVANRHAIGDCSHAGGVEPVERRHAANGRVTSAECSDIRHKYRSGASVTTLAERTGRSESTIYRHVEGDCSHGGDS